MKSLFTILIVALMVLMVTPALTAQTTDVQNLYAVGATFNPGATPQVAGTALWAHAVANTDSKPTYAFTAFDVLPNSSKPFTVSTNVSVGVAQKVVTIGKFPFYVPIAGGPSITGQNLGYNWNTGLMTSFLVKDKFRLCPNVRIVRNNVDGGDYHPMVGLLLAWGE